MNQDFYEEFQRLLIKAPEALKHLKKVTGKNGIEDIEPLKEKRWSPKCWQSWHTLISIMGMIQWGKTSFELDEEVLKSFEPCTFVGKFETGEFPMLPANISMEKFSKVFPDLNQKWKEK